jgi:hypothetical protein
VQAGTTRAENRSDGDEFVWEGKATNLKLWVMRRTGGQTHQQTVQMNCRSGRQIVRWLQAGPTAKRGWKAKPGGTSHH